MTTVLGIDPGLDRTGWAILSRDGRSVLSLAACGLIHTDAGQELPVRLEYIWKPVREVALDTKFFLYTNYQDVEIDLEVNCDFIINRFLSARLSLHPRYDTSVIMDGDTHAKIQFRELLSVGFAHKFY